MKRTLTSVILILVLAAFMALGYFVSPIFIDMLILIFFAGALYEMFMCLKDGGYHMFKAPPIFMLITVYPVFYLMQYFIGGGDNKVSAGIQGILIVLLAAALMCLSSFTFKPAAKERRRKIAKTSKFSPEVSDEAQDEAALNTANDTAIESVSEAKSAQDASSDGDGAEESYKACNLNDLFANIFLIVYPTLFLSAAFVISYKYSAFFAVLFAIAVPIIGSDLFAYLFGKMIGGKKLCPSISPKKTVAGACGGIFGGVLVALILWVVFEYVGGEVAPEFIAKCGYRTFFAHESGGLFKSALVYIALGALCAVISELGDLAASRIKRALGIKDFGKIFPGHGGFLDRIDSVMYSLVILLIAFSCIYGY